MKRKITDFQSLIEIFFEDSFLDSKGIIFIEKEDEERYLSYRELYHQALRILYILQQNGIQAGDEVVLQLEHNQDFVQVLWASLLGGIVPVFTPLGKTDEQKLKLSKVWKVLQRPYLLTTEDINKKYNILSNNTIDPNNLAVMKKNNVMLDKIMENEREGIIYAGKNDDPAVMLFSSGSTGDPKGIILTHTNLLAVIDSIIHASSATSDDIYLSWTPLTHILGLSGFHFIPFFVQSNQYLISTELFLTNPQLWFSKTHELQATILSSPNFGYKHFLEFFQCQNAKKWDLSSVRSIFNIAEPISADLCNEFLDCLAPYGLKRTTMLPCYGMTETGLIITMKPDGEEFGYYNIDRRSILIGNAVKDINKDDDNSAVFVDVGAPIECCSVRICDKNNQILGENIVGYIQAKGKNVITGYYKNPEANKKSFTEDGWLMTGDVGFMRNGRVIVTGRAKNIIFVNGVNYFPHDIERVALGVTGIEEGKIAVCGITDEKERGEKIIGFVVYDQDKDIKDFIPLVKNIKKHINKKMGLELVDVVPVKEIPKTRSGKIQRYKLGSQYKDSVFDELIQKIDFYINEELNNKQVGLPTNSIENILVEIWSEIFGIEKISIYDHFLDMGGNSLKAASVSYKVHKELNVKLEIREVFAIPILKDLAEYIGKAKRSEYSPIVVIEEKEYYPVSSAQKRIYAVSQLEGDQTSYNLPYMMIISGKLDKERFLDALKEILKRHDSLRTVFEMINGQLMQRINKNMELDIVEMVVGDNELENIVAEFVRPFDLSKAPLIRTSLIKFNDQYLFMFDMHHIISDGTSIGIFIDELIQLYKGEDLPELTIQYKDFTVWQEQLFDGEIYKEQEKYWLSQFEDEVPVLNLPTDHVRPVVQSFAGETIKIKLCKELTSQLNHLIKKEDASVFMVLLASFNLLLSRYIGQEDILIGTAVAARSHSDLENMIGMFVNTLAMRNSVKGTKTFVDFLAEVKENSLKAYENQDYQFDMLVEKLGVQRNQDRNALIDVVFVLENTNLSEMNVDDLKFEPYEYRNKTAKFDLTLYAFESDDHIRLEFEYSTDLFKKETIERMSSHFVNILREIVENPKLKIADIEMISEEEKLQILNEFNNTRNDYPKEKTIQQLFEEQVENRPNNIAVVFKGNKSCEADYLSYRELNAKANQLARVLRKREVTAEQIVGIVVEPSLEMIVGILGILKAGGAYLPIDPAYPEERITYMLKDSDTRVLLTQGHLARQLSFTGEIIDLTDEKIYIEDTSNLESITDSTNLAYVIYTSGSTGKPKGVMVEHKSVVNLIWWHVDYYSVTSLDQSTKYAGFSFDASVWEIFPYIVKGATIHIIYDEIRLDIQKLNEYYEANNITISFLPTQICEQIMLLNNQSLRILYTGGDKLKSYIPQRYRLINNYGPTESTVVSTNYEVKEKLDNIPIGKPIFNTQVFILDKNNALQPIGVPGELCISGDSLTRGYLNRPELTAEKFILNPIKQNGERTYRTGDLARWLSDGNIEFLGRIDHQVKIRGFRIELGEIENQLLKHDQVKETVVIERTDHNNHQYLCAYIVSDRELSVTELRMYLNEKLPENMIPSYFSHLEKMPLTPNGKINRKALPEPDGNLVVGTEYVAPTTEAEIKLATIWGNILGTEMVGINDNFFELGGDSIKAIQILARAKEQGINLTVKDVFKYKVISKLLKNVDYGKQKKMISQKEIEGEVLLTPIQKWFFEQKLHHQHYFNQTNLFSVKTDVDLERLEKVFKKIIAHHDVLRMSYKVREGQIVQYNRKIDEVDFKLEFVNLTKDKYSVQREKLKKISEAVQDSLNLETDLLIKAVVFDLGEHGKRLLIAIHHLVIDGVSWRILTEDIENLYKSYLRKELPAKTTSFKEWSQRLSEYAMSDKIDIEYWEKIDQTKIQSLVKMPVNENYLRDHDELLIELDENQTELLLTKVNRAYNTEINDVLLSALIMTFTEVLGTDNILLNLEGHGREEIMDDTDLTRTIGWFTSAFLVYLEKKESIEKTIKHVKENLRRIPNKGVQYGIAQYLGGYTQLQELKAEISFNYLGQFDNSFSNIKESDNQLLSGCNEDAGMYFHINNQHTYLIDINGMVIDGKLRLTISYNTRWISDDLMQKIKEMYVRNMGEILTHCMNKTDQSFTASDFGVENKLDEDDIDIISQLYNFS
ncbi:MAG: amino acid adenylation domain-containing protein [Halanaerobiales bacterium]|nr:amino acid adenylation domain-containing protein [Halanaerobiales bacterium]